MAIVDVCRADADRPPRSIGGEEGDLQWHVRPVAPCERSHVDVHTNDGLGAVWTRECGDGQRQRQARARQQPGQRLLRRWPPTPGPSADPVLVRRLQLILPLRVCAQPLASDLDFDGARRASGPIRRFPARHRARSTPRSPGRSPGTTSSGVVLPTTVLPPVRSGRTRSAPWEASRVVGVTLLRLQAGARPCAVVSGLRPPSAVTRVCGPRLTSPRGSMECTVRLARSTAANIAARASLRRDSQPTSWPASDDRAGRLPDHVAADEEEAFSAAAATFCTASATRVIVSSTHKPHRHARRSADPACPSSGSPAASAEMPVLGSPALMARSRRSRSDVRF